MPILILCLLAVSQALHFADYNDEVFKSASKPVIGMLTLPNDIDFADQPNVKAFIRTPYVHYFESAGMRVVPILHTLDEEELDEILGKINGIVFTGGSTKLNSWGEDGEIIYSQYVKTADYLLKSTIRKNDNGEYFPLMGICLGMEVLTMVTSKSCTLTYTDAWNHTINALFTEKAPYSKLFKNVNPMILYYLNKYNITAQNHHWGISIETYKKKEKLNTFWDILGLSYDRGMVPYLSFIEAKNYPIYAYMFHPEKTPYKWEEAEVDHSIIAIEASQYFSYFFSLEIRKNNNSFEDYEDYIEHSIYTLTDPFLGPEDEQNFIFKRVDDHEC
ncbi:GGH1_4 [Blepharisma stoltei]|uniref:folate gamma-glutamyl hydrolase n=1 Tax=Blepharisma stoltei TaxID=1481888 RepID=A0AAU9JK11_9CILI|nr:unnamed protein product [Blepharisma stoltei]